MDDNLINKRMRRNCGEMSSTRWNRVKPLVHVFQRNTLTEGKATSSICEFFHTHLWVFTLFVGLLFLPFYGIAFFFVGLSRGSLLRTISFVPCIESYSPYTRLFPLFFLSLLGSCLLFVILQPLLQECFCGTIVIGVP